MKKKESKNNEMEIAHNEAIKEAIAMSEIVKSTLGPKGMDKILVSPESPEKIYCTNDGSTILNSIYVDKPAAKVMVDVSKTQDSVVGDGTTSVVILAGELLKEAEFLIQKHKIHPMTIITGFREACEIARKHLELISLKNGGKPLEFRRDLINIANTSLSSKILSKDKNHFSHLSVDAVLRLQGSRDLQMIHIIDKIGGTLKDSFLDEGFIMDKKFGVSQPRHMKNVRILLANTPMDTDKNKIYGIKVSANSILNVAEIEASEKMKMKIKCEKIASNEVNCFINRQLIYDYPEQILSQKGIITIEHADFDGIERLAKVLGSDIVSALDDLNAIKYGYCKMINEIMIGEDKVIHFSGVSLGEACTIVLRGASNQLVDEAKRSIHDALCVLVSAIKDPRILFGGGCTELQMGRIVAHHATRIRGKKSLTLQSFASALAQIPYTLCDNAGIDSAEILSDLKAAHILYGQSCRRGVNVFNGGSSDMRLFGILEAFTVKLYNIISATEAATCILRIDETVVNPPNHK